MDGLSDDEVGMEVDESPPARIRQRLESSSDDDGDSKSSKSDKSDKPAKGKKSRDDDDDDDDDDGSDESSKASKSPRSSKSAASKDEDDDDDDDDEEREERAKSPARPMSTGSSPAGSPAQEEAPPPPPPRYEMELPSANIDVGEKRHFVKLPNFLSIGTHEYDPLYYEDEIDDDENRDYEGRVKLKLRVENTIRWRKTPDGDGLESNARIVEWSDGTMSLYLGSEIFDVNVKPITESSHLFVRMGVRQGLQCQALFDSKLSVRPNSTESFTHRKLTLSLADRSQKTQKIRMLNNPGQDPEARLDELSKKEDDRLKATMRRETKQRRIQERSQSGGPSAAYLEDYDEEDDDGSISLSAIKRNTLARQQDYSDEGEESEEEYSDDSDPEFGKVQRRSDRKKKQVVEDSDDE